MKRVYHHFEKWEEITAGMWRAVHGEERKPLLAAASVLMKDSALFQAHGGHEIQGRGEED